jgi:hypothetical protein
VIRNAVLHLANEQPLLADLFAPPSGRDVSLVCTNLRTMNGSRPVFADHADSLFVFPYSHIRFVEVSAGALAAVTPVLSAGQLTDGSADGSNGSEGSGGGDPARQLVAAIAARAAEQAATATPDPGVEGPDSATAQGGDDGAAPADGPVDDLDEELELDEDFLRRVREI